MTMTRWIAPGLVAVLLLLRPALAADAGPSESFASPEDGFSALTAALRDGDDARMLQVLGPAGDNLIHSGDEVADAEATQKYLSAYDAAHTVVRKTPDLAELQVGPDQWPLPLPMVQHDSKWQFDAAAGAQELVDQRIGRNELDTIQTLRAIGDAQREYADTVGREGVFRAYAQHFFSHPGKRDGLYFATKPGEAESPLGPLLAEASAGGYDVLHPKAKGPQPYHGYVFHMLRGQGASAPGGAMDYVVKGRMIGGFGVLAYPASWGSSGIMTFMISHDGTVWQKNLGPETARLAGAIKLFDPGAGWEKVTE